jgi:hypothetical protein
MKNEVKNPAETLNDIRNLMERSSKFISLSGFSGVIIGSMAILCVAWYCSYYGINPLHVDYDYLASLPAEHTSVALACALGLMLLSITVTMLLTAQRAAKMKVSIWGQASKRLVVNMFIPLSAGLVFCLALFFRHIDLVLPVSLLVYGMALFNAGSYTQQAIRSLGMVEMLLGILCMIFIEYHILIWTIGFGMMHILYGAYMYFKFEKIS